MPVVDQEGAFILAQLMVVIVEDNDEYPDHVLLEHCAYIYDVLLQGVQYLSSAGIEPPTSVLDFLARFMRAAHHPETED